MTKDEFGNIWLNERFNGNETCGLANSLILHAIGAPREAVLASQHSERPLGGWDYAFRLQVSRLERRCPDTHEVRYEGLVLGIYPKREADK